MNKDQFVHYIMGIPHLDKQHWELFLNLQSLSDSKSKEEAIGVVGDVVHQWAMHSHAEEEYMRSINYPFIAAHSQTHVAFLEKFYNLKDRIRDTNFQYGLKGHVMTLEEILRHHIEYDDMQYAEFGKKK